MAVETMVSGEKVITGDFDRNSGRSLILLMVAFPLFQLHDKKAPLCEDELVPTADWIAIFAKYLGRHVRSGRTDGSGRGDLET